MRPLLLSFLLASAVPLCAQESKDQLRSTSDQAQGVFDRKLLIVNPADTLPKRAPVEQRPQFPGGETAMYAYVREHFTMPDEVTESGSIYLQFVVLADGQVDSVNVKRGMNEQLDSEAMRVVKHMPHWMPGTINGTPVRSKMVLPIRVDAKTTPKK